MAKKMNQQTVWIIVLVLAGLWFMQNQGTTDTGGSEGGIDVCALVEPTAKFTAKRMFLEGTAVSDQVQVIKINGGGDRKELAQVSSASGTMNIEPNVNYRFYFGNTSQTTYYTHPYDYTGPCVEKEDVVTGVMCTIGTPSLTIKDENGMVQSGSSNVQAIGADSTKKMTFKMDLSAADTCYGNPNAASDNAICFKYNTTTWTDIDMNWAGASIPYSISNAFSSYGHAIKCFQLPKIEDLATVEENFVVESGSTNPTSVQNITIYIEDVAWDLNADTLDDIWGFQDEDNNNVGSSTIYTVNATFS